MRAVLGLTVFGFFLLAPMSTAEQPKLEQPNLELKGKVLPPSILPFQAIRKQVSLTNKGATDVTILPLESSHGGTEIWFPEMKYPVSCSLHRGLLHEPIVAENLLGTPQPPFYLYHYYTRLKLKAGETEALVTDLVYHYFPDPVRPGQDEAASLFAKLGEYQLGTNYHAKRSRFEERPWFYVSRPFSFKVEHPKGIDGDVYKQLVANPKLPLMMLAPEIHAEALPDPKTVAAVERLVLRYPRSAYADYGRWALALVCLGGSDRIDQATPEQKKEARIALRALNLKEFAYAPRALVLLRQIAEDEAEKKGVTETLDRDFPNDLVWLRAKDNEALSPELIKRLEAFRLNQALEPYVRGPRKAQP